jgi:hypothetical protein
VAVSNSASPNPVPFAKHYTSPASALTFVSSDDIPHDHPEGTELESASDGVVNVGTASTRASHRRTTRYFGGAAPMIIRRP